MTDNDSDLRRWRLPRGRHGLPRELVMRSQRERLLAAAADRRELFHLAEEPMFPVVGNRTKSFFRQLPARADRLDLFADAG